MLNFAKIVQWCEFEFTKEVFVLYSQVLLYMLPTQGWNRAFLVRQGWDTREPGMNW